MGLIVGTPQTTNSKQQTIKMSSNTRSTLSEAQNNVIMWLFKQAGNFAEGDTLTEAQETLMQQLLEDKVITNKQALAIEAHVIGEEPVVVENTAADKADIAEAKEIVAEEEAIEAVSEPKPKRAKSEYMLYKEKRVAELVEGGMSKADAGRQAKAEWKTALKEAKEAKQAEKLAKKAEKKRGRSPFQQFKMDAKALLLEHNPEMSKIEAGKEVVRLWNQEPLYSKERNPKKNTDFNLKVEAIMKAIPQ